MKSRHIAIALGDVYAIGLGDEVMRIERNADGFWGEWQPVGARAKRLVHGGEVIGLIELDDRVAAFQRVPGPSWTRWDLHVTELSAAHMPGDGPVLFAAATGRVWHAWKEAPNSPWSAWEPLDGPVSNISAGRIPGGGLVIFGIRDGCVHHRWQDKPASPWTGWTELGSPPAAARALELTTLRGGGLAIFALGADGDIYHRARSPSSRSGRTTVFAAGSRRSRSASGAHGRTSTGRQRAWPRS